MKMKKSLLSLFVLQIIIAMCSLHSYALEKPAHEAINVYIAQNAIKNTKTGFSFSLDEYLKERLGFREGVYKIVEQFEDQKINGEHPTIFRWLGYGGKKEDEPFLLRSVRHFHNPIETWDKAGLKGIWDSSIIWGQRTDQRPGGHYSWQDVKGYFYSALTSADQTTRENYFAETFRGLGQQMHLIEDASVPLHTRDDIHIIFNYENWVEKVQKKESATFSEWLSDFTRYGYEKSVLNIAPNPLAPIPIARIIDTDKYNGDNPGVTIYESIGIAEYSNANFFTKDTKFGDFPSPNWDNVQCVDYEIQGPRDSSTMVFRPYYKKNIVPPAPDGDTGYRLATVGYLFDYAKRYFPSYLGLFRAWEKPGLDANVYRDYAERLIPRAVGYSAGLLDYFFRGKLEVSVPEEQVFSMTEGIAIPHWLISVTAEVKNTTPDEEMQAGIIQAFVRYKRASEQEYSFSVSEPIPVSGLSSEDPTEFSFDFSGDPIPSGAEDSYLHVVFKGTLGNEQGSAIAVGMKDLFPDIIEISVPGQGVYALMENSDQGFSEIRLLAKNISPDAEEMPDGSINLVVQYRVALEDPFQSQPVPTTEEFFYLTVNVNGVRHN